MRLDPDGLRAVSRHAQRHERRNAPAWVVVWSGLRPFLGRWGRGTAWLERERAQIEIEADAHALAHGVKRGTLARAILKLADISPRIPVAAFSATSDLRLRALLGEDEPSSAQRSTVLVVGVAAAAFAVGLCSVLSVI